MLRYLFYPIRNADATQTIKINYGFKANLTNERRGEPFAIPSLTFKQIIPSSS